MGGTATKVNSVLRLFVHPALLRKYETHLVPTQPLSFIKRVATLASDRDLHGSTFRSFHIHVVLAAILSMLTFPVLQGRNVNTGTAYHGMQWRMRRSGSGTMQLRRETYLRLDLKRDREKKRAENTSKLTRILPLGFLRTYG